MDWQSIYGHGRIKKDLQELLQRDRMPHALLFCGTEGIGKSLTAKVLAKSLLCSAPHEGLPCGICRSCRAFEEGSHPDFFYLEPEEGKAVKVIKIEQIRRMQSALSLSPALSGRRAIVIDGAEYMNETSVNSLLKTLEEPSGETYFILVSAHKEMLLPTVLSRCTKIYFAPLREEETAGILAKRGISPDKAAIIARLSGGSASRALNFIDSDALKLRSQALSLWENKLTDRYILEQTDELAGLERRQISLWASFMQQILRDLLLLSGGISTSLLCNRDVENDLFRIAGSVSRHSLLQKLSLTKQLISRLNSNAEARLLLQNFLLQWRKS